MRPPDLYGHASAWLIPINPARQKENPAWQGTLCQYLIHCTWAHLAWSWYNVSGISLRDIPGVPPAKLQFPGATHEVQILALNPKTPHDPDKLYSGEQGLDWLSPPDLIHQVGGINDDQFKSIVQAIVLAIVESRASPDVDFRRFWQASIDVTAQHYREGKHKAQ